MTTSVYAINKGINQSIEFKGLKAQWIWWLGGGCVVLLICFAILYIAGVNTFVALGIMISLGTAWVMQVYKMSRQFGEHGLMKKIARRRIPALLCNRTRTIFFHDLFCKDTVTPRIQQ